MSKKKSQSEMFMKRALELAEKGRAFVLPNPMVGAVLVKDGKIIGEGFHEKFGEAHAEAEALKNCIESPKDATLYVTLEPCPHLGKTPPCVQSIIKNGIKKVVIATKDPSDKVNGKGIQALQSAGIEVELGLLEVEAQKLNEAFFTYHQKKRPFIAVKAAMSMDAKIALNRHAKTSITGPKSQIKSHVLRSIHQAILVGAGTVIADDPHLGVRVVPGRDPLRIILQGEREICPNSKIFRDKNVVLLNGKSIHELLNELYENGIVSVLVEGGQNVYKTFIEAKLVDRFHFFLAPKQLGKEALSFYENPYLFALNLESMQELGEDFYLSATPLWSSASGS